MTTPETVSRYRLPPPTRQSTAVVGRRLAQGLLDVALSSVLPALALLLYLLTVPLEGEFARVEMFTLFSLLVLALVAWCYAWYWAGRPSRRGRGQTTGMRLLGIRVVDADGGPVSTTQLVVRWLLLPLDLALVGAVVMLLDERHRRLGDVAAGTVVIRDWLGRSAERQTVIIYQFRQKAGIRRRSGVPGPC